MSDKNYSDPNLKIHKIYTRGGDTGQTSLIGGQRVAKDAKRIDTYGTVDELSAFLGSAIVTARELSSTVPTLSKLTVTLVRIQHELFNLGTMLATTPGEAKPSQPKIGQTDIDALETEMDAYNLKLPQLSSFLLPGSSRLSSELHICRTICRRAERLCVALQREEDPDATTAALPVKYLNRLSDALFVFSRLADTAQGADELLWDPNLASSGKLVP
jgi:cob(I)alamin adenosyltransferase